MLPALCTLLALASAPGTADAGAASSSAGGGPRGDAGSLFQEAATPLEEQMFGGPEVVPSAPDGGAPPTGPRPSEEQIFGVSVSGPGADAGTEPRAQSRSAELLESRFPYEATELPPENPLTVGGMLYLRSQFSASDNTPVDQWLLSAPFLLDTYLDARPNDRVRGFVLVRTLFDPTYNPAQPSQVGITLPPLSNPDFLIDQMWIKFDVARKVFVTVGRQHVKWGTAHFWFPNDLLNPVRLQPLAVFDQRTGVTMIKADLPLSAENLNVYAIGLFEGLQQANTLGTLGGAARAEYVLNTIELGLDTVATQGQHNRYGGDVSFGIWDFDLYAEGVLTDGRDNPLWEETFTAPGCFSGPTQSFNPACYQTYDPKGYQAEVAAGLNYSFRYGNNRTVTLGGEYFYNGLGYSNPSIYPWLFLNNAATFFYLGQNYAGLYLLADKPGSWYNTTINLSTIGDLSDRTFISRIDVFQIVLTHLRVEAFADVHYGANGEFHFSFNSPAVTTPFGSVPAINVQPPSFDVGLALRLSL
ncbi:MAG: hypothetical protein ACYDCL_19745 [Myxococcales bacterium]